MIQQARHFFQRKFVQDTITLQISKIGVMILGLLAWIVVPVRLGPHNYGLFALVQSFLGIWQIFNLTGIKTSTSVLLSTAIGARDDAEILDLMAVYVKVSLLWALLSLVTLLLLGPPIAALIYRDPLPPSAAQALAYPLLAGLETVGNSQVGTLAALLALILFFDPIYSLVLIAFRSRRSMRLCGVLQNVNQFVLTISLVTAALITPTPEGQVAARLFYSASTMLIALYIYRRARGSPKLVFPSIGAIARRALRVSYGPYWRFGFANAVDKNISNAYEDIVLQMVGIIAGPAATSYVQIAVRGLNKLDFFTSSIFENIQAVVPQYVGRQQYGRLQANFRRVLGVLALGGLAFYGLVVLLAPVFIVPLFGKEWIPVLPLLPALSIYGVVTTVGGYLRAALPCLEFNAPDIGHQSFHAGRLCAAGAVAHQRHGGAGRSVDDERLVYHLHCVDGIGDHACPTAICSQGDRCS